MLLLTVCYVLKINLHGPKKNPLKFSVLTVSGYFKLISQLFVLISSATSRVGEVVTFSTFIPSGMRALSKKFQRDLYRGLKISQNNLVVKFFDEKISHSKDITLRQNTESRLAEPKF